MKISQPAPKPPKKTDKEKLRLRLEKLKERQKRALQKLREKNKREKWKNRPKAVHKRELDAWALAVKEAAGHKCEYCGKEGKGLNAHHIFSVKNKTTCYYVPNGCCLCANHHVFSTDFSAHKTPTEFTEWIIEKRGREWYNTLRSLAKKTIKDTDDK